MRRLISAVVALATAATLIVAGPTPAANAVPIINSMNCSSSNNEIRCSMTYQSTGPGPVHITWWEQFFTHMGIIAEGTTSMAIVCATPGERRYFQLEVSDGNPLNGGGIARNDFSVDCVGLPNLRITFFDCDTGAGLIFCSVQYTGGTPPISIRWVVDGVAKPQFNDSSRLRIGCQVGRSFSVGVVVLDSIGRSATDAAGCLCSRTQQ